MDDITELDKLILRLATGGVDSQVLRQKVMSTYPGLLDGKYFSALLSLQNNGGITGEEIDGAWVLTSSSEKHVHEDRECSPEFAEMIVAMDCSDEWHEIDVDELIAELDDMIQKARARKAL